MTTRRSWWLGVLLGGELAIVLAGPAALVWNELRPEPWDLRTLRVRFESARYEAAALVFTYRIENRTRRSVRLLPDVTRIVVRQPADRPPLGYPALDLPIELTAGSAQRIEVRLELPSPPLTSGGPELSEEQTKRILQYAPRDASDPNPQVPPLPMRELPPQSTPEPVSPDAYLDATLEYLNGFELINESKGVHLLLPRGW
jgi:hypothetical protein